jgi:hypothetical protein
MINYFNKYNYSTLLSGRRRKNKTIQMVANDKMNRAPNLPKTWVKWFVGFPPWRESK